MIFITVGSQKFQFNRLLKAVDELVVERKIVDEIFAQIGASDYKPQNYQFKDFLDRDEFLSWIDKADIVITHGGTGTIIGALKKGKKVIAVPRLSKYGEHVNDHQVQLMDQLKTLDLICNLNDCSELEYGLKFVKEHEFNIYESDSEKIIESIEEYINREIFFE